MNVSQSPLSLVLSFITNWLQGHQYCMNLVIVSQCLLSLNNSKHA